MTTYSNIVVVTQDKLTAVKQPALPFAPVDYQQKYQDDVNNVLRLYFNQINALISQLKLSATNTLSLPYGAFHQDGTTTLSVGITNNSTTPISVASTVGFPSSGYILIGSELIQYTGITSTTFTGITRGTLGTTQAAHNAGDAVSEAQGTGSGTTIGSLLFTATDYSNGVTVDPANNGHIIFSQTGTYNIALSAQALNFTNNADNVTIWIRKNSADVATTASIGTVSAIHGGVAGAAIISYNIFLQVVAGDYISVKWTTDSGNSVIATYPPGISPVHPTSPAIILTANFVSGA